MLPCARAHRASRAGPLTLARQRSGRTIAARLLGAEVARRWLPEGLLASLSIAEADLAA
jgi:hypothetical protein